MEHSSGAGNIHVGGSVGAYAQGNTYGVAVGITGGYAYVGGDVVAISTTSAAVKTFGFYGNVSGDVGAHIVGNVVAEGVDGTTVGVGALSTGGNVTLYVGGDIYAGSTHGVAAGAIAESVNGSITVEGNVIARGYDIRAIGVEVANRRRRHPCRRRRGRLFTTSNAYGVVLAGTGGYAYVGGNLVAISTTNVATKTFGLYGNVSGDI